MLGRFENQNYALLSIVILLKNFISIQGLGLCKELKTVCLVDGNANVEYFTTSPTFDDDS